MAGIREGRITTADVAGELYVSQRWVQTLYGKYLSACSRHKENLWTPGCSGGSHNKPPPKEVFCFWRERLEGRPPYSYSFTASETLRLFGVEVDRATVRRWALRNGVGKPKERKREPASVRRWQCEAVGSLWQLDVTPHRWFGDENDPLPLFDMIDDCSRVMTGSRLYPRECLLAYLDFLRNSFETYGLPTFLYVDFHSFFFSAMPDMLTYLGEVLQWLGISFKYAPTPQAKGKVERQHLFWQNRLPGFFASEHINQIGPANKQIDMLREHHNDHEIHRELRMTPTEAWRKAIREKRCVLKERPATPWWPYLWTVRSLVKVSFDGTILLGTGRIKLPNSCGHRYIHCHHPDGSYTLLASPFGVGKPIVIRRLQGVAPTWTI